MLDSVASHHRIQFQGKLKIQTPKNGEKPQLEPDLAVRKNFFIKLVVSQAYIQNPFCVSILVRLYAGAYIRLIFGTILFSLIKLHLVDRNT